MLRRCVLSTSVLAPCSGLAADRGVETRSGRIVGGDGVGNAPVRGESDAWLDEFEASKERGELSFGAQSSRVAGASVCLLRCSQLPTCNVAGFINTDVRGGKIAARRQNIQVSGQQTLRLVCGVNEVQHSDDQQRDGLGEVDRVP